MSNWSYDVNDDIIKSIPVPIVERQSSHPHVLGEFVLSSELTKTTLTSTNLRTWYWETACVSPVSHWQFVCKLLTSPIFSQATCCFMYFLMLILFSLHLDFCFFSLLQVLRFSHVAYIVYRAK